MSGEMIYFYGSVTTVIDHSVNVANANCAGGAVTFDNSTLKYPSALATLAVPGSFSAAPTNLSTVNLFMVRQDVDGTDDDTSAPASTDVEAAEFVGAFPIYDTNEVQRVTIPIDLRGVQKALFFIENRCGVTMNVAGGNITVKIMPFSIGPAP